MEEQELTSPGVFSDEFAVQTCSLGRYGQEMGSDQFGATLVASPDARLGSATQRIVIRLSNVEVRNDFSSLRFNRTCGDYSRSSTLDKAFAKTAIRSTSISAGI